MNMPGFTAEVSLYRTSERYHMVGTSAPSAGGGEVVPQSSHDCWPIGEGWSECHECTDEFCQVVIRPPK